MAAHGGMAASTRRDSRRLPRHVTSCWISLCPWPMAIEIISRLGGFLQTFLSVAVLGSIKIYNPKTLCHAHFSDSFKPKCETKSWQYLLWPRLCHLPTPFPFQLLPLCCAVSNAMGCARLVGGIKTQHFIIKKVDRQTA